MRVPLTVAELLAQASRADTDDHTSTDSPPFEALVATLDAAATGGARSDIALRLLTPVGQCLHQLSSEAWPSLALFRRLCEQLCQICIHETSLRLRPSQTLVLEDQDQPAGQCQEVDRLAVSLLCLVTASSSVCQTASCLLWCTVPWQSVLAISLS